MAEAVVQRLEVVDVEKDRADLRVADDRVEMMLGLFDERAAVLQAGQRIGRGELRELAFEQEVIAPEAIEAEVKHRRSRHADRDDPRPDDRVDVMGQRLVEQQRERRRIEQRGAGEKVRGREPQRRGADGDHHHRGQEPQQWLLDAADIQRHAGDQHLHVRDADCAEQPCRAGAGNRQHEQREDQRAGQPVSQRCGWAADQVARPDQTEERHHGKCHRHRGKRPLMF